MEQPEGICNREQCRYVGPLPASNLLLRIIGSMGITLFWHFGCFPFLLLFPVTFPVMLVIMVVKTKWPCPACRRGRMEPLSTPRGQVLKARLEQSRRQD